VAARHLLLDLAGVLCRFDSTARLGVDPQCAAVGHQIDAWPDSGRGESPQPTSELGNSCRVTSSNRLEEIGGPLT
jgi:hypothetical protein